MAAPGSGINFTVLLNLMKRGGRCETNFCGLPPSVRKASGFPFAFIILSVRLRLTDGEAKPRALSISKVPESQRLSARKEAEPQNRQVSSESRRLSAPKAAEPQNKFRAASRAVVHLQKPTPYFKPIRVILLTILGKIR